MSVSGVVRRFWGVLMRGFVRTGADRHLEERKSNAEDVESVPNEA